MAVADASVAPVQLRPLSGPWAEATDAAKRWRGARLRADRPRLRDLGRLQTALTHSSARRAGIANNERLEFLGDRVLGLVIADMLFQAFPDAPEGRTGGAPQRAGQRRHLRRRRADEIGLLETVIRADSAVRSGAGAKAKNVLADATEALIAAIYLDGGIDPARHFILKYWDKRSRAIADIPRDAKTELQEWAHQAAARARPMPIEKREGPDHEPVFTVAVELPGSAAGARTGRLEAGGRTRGGRQKASSRAKASVAGRRPTDMTDDRPTPRDRRRRPRPAPASSR